MESANGDEFLMMLASRHSSIDALLRTFFSFLHRKTDFYVVADKPGCAMGFPDGVAEKILLDAFRSCSFKSINGGPVPGNESGAKKQAIAPSHAKKTDKEKVPKKGSDRVKKNCNTSKALDTAPKAQGHEKTPTNSNSGHPRPIKQNISEIQYNDKGEQIPIENGGIGPNYYWTQTLREITIHIPVPAETKAKDIFFDIKRDGNSGKDATTGKKGAQTVTVGLKPQTTAAELYRNVHRLNNSNGIQSTGGGVEQGTVGSAKGGGQGQGQGKGKGAGEGEGGQGGGEGRGDHDRAVSGAGVLLLLEGFLGGSVRHSESIWNLTEPSAAVAVATATTGTTTGAGVGTGQGQGQSQGQTQSQGPRSSAGTEQHTLKDESNNNSGAGAGLALGRLGRELVVSLEKAQETWWRAIIAGHPPIDATKVDSTRRIDDYDDATQGAIRKIVYEQRQKQTQEQQQHHHHQQQQQPPHPGLGSGPQVDKNGQGVNSSANSGGGDSRVGGGSGSGDSVTDFSQLDPSALLEKCKYMPGSPFLKGVGGEEREKSENK